ncbi:MAG: apolipoprotein N-acyltransferase [Proteobacteria bacterium]|nr:apolipoprotein N-acyltransferase [Pseudomonadota bacterium]
MPDDLKKQDAVFKINSTFNIQNSTLQTYRFLPIFSGILIILCHPPISLSSIAYISLIPLLCSLKKDNFRQNFISGFITGIVSYLGLIYWVVIAMNSYGGIDIYTSFLILLLFALYLSFYNAIFAVSLPYLESRLSIPLFVSAPVIWVILEYLRGIVFSGFPWYLLAYSQHKFLPFIQVVSVTGPYFISFLIVAVNCIFYQIFVGKQEKAEQIKGHAFFIYMLLISVLYTGTLVYGYGRIKFNDEGDMKAAIIQGNILQNVKWDEAFKAKIIRTYCLKTLEAGKDVDLVIWPETAMPFVFNDEIYVKRIIGELSATLKTNILFGTVSRNSMGKYCNSAYVYDKTGGLTGSYNKVHLVPYGEYTPLLKYLPFLAKFTAAGGDFVSGEAHKPIETAVGKIGVLICYEGTFPYITNDTVRRGGQVLINITNDAWFGKTSAPYQHLVFYVFRAIETDRYVLRAANTGISAIIDPRGHIKQKTDIFTEDAIRGKFSLRNGQTFYVRYGDYFVLMAFLFLTALCIIKYLKNNKKGANDSSSLP